jgi:hypothetical protein
VRNPLLAGLVALVAGTVAVVSMHLVDYQRTMATVECEPLRLPSTVTARLLEDDRVLNYLDATAELGLTISGKETGGLNLGYLGTYLYWGAELLLVVVLASLGGSMSAREAFCSTCRSWKEERFLGAVHDGGPTMQRDLRKGDLGVLKPCPARQSRDALALSVHVCPHCGTDAPVELKLDRLNRVTDGNSLPWPLVLTMPGDALPALEDGCHQSLETTGVRSKS